MFALALPAWLTRVVAWMVAGADPATDPAKVSRDAGQGRGVGPPGVDVTAQFAAHADFLLRVAWRLTGSRVAAEDSVQETFLVLHKRRAEVSDTPELRGWLYRVLRNVVRHQRRSVARRDRLESALGSDVTATPRDDGATGANPALERRDGVARIRAAVAALPLPQREVFVLYELDELSGKEISALLGIAEGTVWTRLHAARQTLTALHAGGAR